MLKQYKYSQTLVRKIDTHLEHHSEQWYNTNNYSSYKLLEYKQSKEEMFPAMLTMNNRHSVREKKLHERRKYSPIMCVQIDEYNIHHGSIQKVGWHKRQDGEQSWYSWEGIMKFSSFVISL